MKTLFQSITNSINKASRNQRAAELKHLRKQLRAMQKLSDLFARTDVAVLTAAQQGVAYPACYHTSDDVQICGLLVTQDGKSECDVHLHPKSYEIIDIVMGYDIDHIHRGATMLRNDITSRLPDIKAHIKSLKK